MSDFSDFLLGSQGKIQQQSTLGKEQQGLYSQLQNASTQGNGGSFGEVGNYYRGLLGNNSEDFNAMAEPELRRFREKTVPGLAEQFAGFGSGGGLSGSGFRNASLNASTDLSERLASLRAGLRGQGAQGLMGLGQQGLGNYNENIYMQPTTGFLGSLAQGLGSAAGSFTGQKAPDILSALAKALGIGQ